MNIRIKFEKHGSMKFVGHLDIMRYFQKVMRRAGVDIKYSGGFSPHQIMSFAQPLGLGITSEGEYMDIEVNSTLSSAEMIEKINSANVPEIIVTGYSLLPADSKKAMSVMAAADYRITLSCEDDSLAVRLKSAFESSDKVIYKREGKSGILETDIIPLVYSFDVSGSVINVKLSCCSSDNLRPDVFMSCLFECAGAEPVRYSVHRVEMYTGSASLGFTALKDMGEVIDEAIYSDS